MDIIDILLLILRAYYYMIFLFILLGWIVEARKSSFYHMLGVIVEPFFRVFKGWFVFGQLDFTPLLGLFLYNILLEFISANL